MNSVESWRRTLDQILNKEEYQMYYRDQRNLLQRLWDRLKEWVMDLIYEWFGGLTPSSTTGDIIVALLLIAVLVAVLFLAIYLIRNWRVTKQLKTTRPLKGIDIQSAFIEDYQNSLKVAEADENYKLAVRYQFLILLFKLDNKNWLIKENWKTNWDYYQELARTRKRKSELFYPLAVYFEAVTYGNMQVKSDDYLNYVKKIHAFEQEE